MKFRKGRGLFGGQRRKSPACGEGVYIAKGSVFTCNTSIGTGTQINGPMVAKGPGSLSIGNHCAIGQNIRIITTNHSLGHLNVQHNLQEDITGRVQFGGRRDVQIGSNCWIGDCVIILAGVQLGNGCVVGAGAVITKSFSSCSVLAGVPARLLRKRFDDEIIQALEDLAWWKWDLQTMRRHSELFDTNLDELSNTEFLDLIQRCQS